MAHARVSIGTHPLRADPSRPYLSAQPDLLIGRTLDHALRCLSSAARRPSLDYAAAWIAEAEDIGLEIKAHCRRDGKWCIDSSQIADGQERERRRREIALTEHMHATDGAYEAVISLCRRRGQYSDDRGIETRLLVAIVRNFIDTGGRVFVGASGRPGISPDVDLLTKSQLCDRERADAHLIAYREAAGLMRRRHAHGRLARIARVLGTSSANGSHIFERKAAARVADMVEA